MKHKLAITIGILFLTGFGAMMMELSLAVGHQAATAPAHNPTPTKTVAPLSTAPALATPSPTPPPTTTATPLPTATTNGFVHLRAGTSASSANLADLQTGTVVELSGAAQGLWQPVIYQGTSGYIYTTYLAY